ncbi:MAG: hypothetical protein KQA41_00675 [Candidatus Aenigmarchaeota archaeon]|nr:hypothetical protein [Candidatus Aenigmarchaeota archaeon]
MNITKRILLGITALGIALNSGCLPYNGQNELRQTNPRVVQTQQTPTYLQTPPYPTPFTPTVTPENFARDYLRTATTTATQTPTATQTSQIKPYDIDKVCVIKGTYILESDSFSPHLFFSEKYTTPYTEGPSTKITDLNYALGISTDITKIIVGKNQEVFITSPYFEVEKTAWGVYTKPSIGAIEKYDPNNKDHQQFIKALQLYMRGSSLKEIATVEGAIEKIDNYDILSLKKGEEGYIKLIYEFFLALNNINYFDLSLQEQEIENLGWMIEDLKFLGVISDKDLANLSKDQIRNYLEQNLDKKVSIKLKKGDEKITIGDLTDNPSYHSPITLGQVVTALNVFHRDKRGILLMLDESNKTLKVTGDQKEDNNIYCLKVDEDRIYSSGKPIDQKPDYLKITNFQVMGKNYEKQKQILSELLGINN